MNHSLNYIGTELELFSEARKWKNYWASMLAPYIKGDVLEVGAGIGGSTTALSSVCNFKTWTLLEPDPKLFEQLSLNEKFNHSPFHAINAQISDIYSDQFDTILYIDVLEHIKNDQEEIQKASKLIRPGGHIIVLCPAYQHLYSPFDKNIGHFLRYSRVTLNKCRPKGFTQPISRYLDSIGYLASLANLLFLKQSLPTKQQIRFWDQKIVPISKIIDPLLFYSFGKTIISVWKAPYGVAQSQSQHSQV